ncbi:pyrimidine 5'-nucleotidase [Methyloceanibacter sp.]|uniref:pyrimidine 5'-nucleotidase n=1 Tax=Methyloceanibacter sp. TaxID=1965321 RepID=UPI002CF3382E|nr:pyrimidine 5'-nucleotidase [Methyloceanibacter sp.]HML91260.1 pyrimidine 5'-nucleotidase [Methyloceanibacter sp.]
MSGIDDSAPGRGFGHIETWVFDLDNTLYPAECDLFAQIDHRMGTFIAERLSLSLEDAHVLRKQYYFEHGTTLAGLIRLHGVKPHDFLDYVHDIDLGVVAPNPELGAAIDALPGRKLVFTNGSRNHAEAVAAKVGVLDRFEDIFDIHDLEYVNPKPSIEAFNRFVTAHGIVAPRAAIFDDLPHNLETAHGLGMTTVWIDCRAMGRPEHVSGADWAELPEHIHHRTEALAPFVAAVAAAIAEEAEGQEAPGRDHGAQ